MLNPVIPGIADVAAQTHPDITRRVCYEIMNTIPSHHFFVKCFFYFRDLAIFFYYFLLKMDKCYWAKKEVPLVDAGQRGTAGGYRCQFPSNRIKGVLQNAATRPWLTLQYTNSLHQGLDNRDLFLQLCQQCAHHQNRHCFCGMNP